MLRTLARTRSFDPFKRALNDVFEAMERDFAHPFGVVARPPFGSSLLPSTATGEGLLEWLYREDHNMLETVSRRGSFGMNLDVQETDKSFELSADLPGIRKEDITVDLDSDSNVLTVSGERRKEHEEEDDDSDGHERYHYFERSYGRTTRSVRLPDNVDASKTNAAYRNGVLRLSVPKRDALPSSRVNIPIAGGEGNEDGRVALDGSSEKQPSEMKKADAS